MQPLDPADAKAVPLGLGPFPVIAAGFLLGIAGGGNGEAGGLRGEIPVAVVILTGILLCAVGALTARRSGAVLLAASALLGFARHETSPEPAREAARWCQLLDAGEGALARIEGSIVKIPLGPPPAREAGGAASRILLRCEFVETRQGAVPVHGELGVSLEGPVPRHWIGARVKIFGYLRTGSTSPQLRTHPGAVKVVADAGAFDVDASIERLRYDAAARLAERLDGAGLGTALALVLGLYSAMPGDLLTAHADTGTLPFLAISGSHVVLVAAAGGQVLGRRRTRQQRVWLLTVLLLVYACIAGRSPPVVRAALGFCFILGARAAGRIGSPLSALSAALTLELWFRPDEAFSAGLQLSYAAVLGFVLFLTPVRARILAALPGSRIVKLRSARRALATTLAFAVVAFLSTAWICAAQFGQVSPVAVVLSLPLTVLIPPMLLAAWGALLPGVMGLTSASAFLALERVEREVVLLGDRLPASPSFVSEFAAASLGLAGLAVLLLLTSRPWSAVLCGVLAVVATAAIPATPRGNLDIWLHACGHGFAATVVGPEGTALQLDAGSRDIPDLTRRRLRHALDVLGVRRFEAASVSHADADHGNAMGSLLERFPARVFLRHRDSPWSARFQGEPPPIQAEEWTLDMGSATARWILVNPSSGASDNDQALATLLEFAGRRVLFPADIEREGVDALLRRLPDPRFDILVMPHHGLDNGQVETLLAAVKPELAVASNGSRYSTRATEELLERRGLRLYSTRDHGSLRLRIAPDGAVELSAGCQR